MKSQNGRPVVMSDEKNPSSRGGASSLTYADIRETLEQALVLLDQAKYTVAAAYVEHAIEALDEENSKSSRSANKH